MQPAVEAAPRSELPAAFIQARLTETELPGMPVATLRDLLVDEA